jgi:hypothetical protein
MKTMKIILITALVTLGASLTGQQVQVKFTALNQSEKYTRFEYPGNGFLSMTDRNTWRGQHEPVSEMSYTKHHFDVVDEKEYGTENWMAAPNEWSMESDGLEIEPWMATPYQWIESEPALAVEQWMTRPFEAAEYIAIESWMGSTF